MTRFESLTRQIDALTEQIVIERRARRGTDGLVTLLRKYRTERMKLGRKLIKRERKAA